MSRVAFRYGLTCCVFALMTLLALPVAAQTPYKIQPGDQLRIEVIEDPALNRVVLVLPDGNITFPFAGQMRAAGRTVLAVQNSLTAALAPSFATTPTVFVSADALHRKEGTASTRASAPVPLDKFGVYAMGEINKPGKVEIPEDEGITLLQAIAQVGGFTRFAATKRIQLRRPGANGEAVYIFNYKQGRGISGATALKPGDVIVVPERRLFE